MQGPKSHGLDPTLLNIHLQPDLELNTHNTFGEHAIKEGATWNEFLHTLESTGRSPAVAEPTRYYLQEGPGRFYRAYRATGKTMIAGMTVAPNEQGGYTVDNACSDGDAPVTATAYHQLVAGKFFSEFSGLPQTGKAATNLVIPRETAAREPGLARAVYDLGLVSSGANVVVPMPGRAPLPFEGMDDSTKRNTRERIVSHNITGVFPHTTETDDTQIITNEYFRLGQFVGKRIDTYVYPDNAVIPDQTTVVETVDGRIVPLSSAHKNTAQHVRALRTLAEVSPQVSDLILGT